MVSANVHNAPVTSLCLIPTANQNDSKHTIASSSHDLTAAISNLELNSDGTPSTASVLATLHLHTAPVSSVASDSSGNHLLTSSWDGLIGLWNTDIPSTDEVPEPDNSGRERRKRRKIANDSNPRRKAPINVLKSHTSRVSRVVFGEKPGVAYSCGFDSTVRLWDTELGVSTQTIVRVFLALSLSATKYPIITVCRRKAFPRSRSIPGWAPWFSNINRPNNDTLRFSLERASDSRPFFLPSRHTLLRFPQYEWKSSRYGRL